ncbi:unnamed protein product [Caenorhabditis bovis]|uniref:Uncharacterized protein n=1 Tax=Caenorhabditis bovis TaxID=2654633 RepID=A0A8S1F7V8_9PELO|nr:unnamed protein product [Caenorhabditis bovis]
MVGRVFDICSPPQYFSSLADRIEKTNQNDAKRYMAIYDDVSNYCQSPTSTVISYSGSSTPSSSMSPTSHQKDDNTPLYENIEEMTRLCSSSSSRDHSKLSKPSVSDFLKSIPPPPPPIYDDVVYNKRSELDSNNHTTTSSLASSSASSRRHIIAAVGGGGGTDQHGSSNRPSAQSRRCIDMRPLSLPHKEMQRIEREQSHRVLIITLLIITILILLIALSIYIFYDDIEQHINSISGSF